MNRPPNPAFWSCLIVLFALSLRSLKSQELDPQYAEIPITQGREAYFHVSEDGSGLSCGAYLIGTFPVYKNYTNRANYVYFTDRWGLKGWSGIRSWNIPVAPPGGSFKFTATFTGRSGGNSGNVDCGRYMNAWQDLPAWFVYIKKQGPKAAFTNHFIANTPGAVDFAAKSTEPEGDPLTHQWDFGDNETASADLVVHQYKKPGPFSVALTARDSDGLTNQLKKTITIPAPKPIVSIRLLSKHSGNQIEPEEEFAVRVTVQASDDGVGDLANLSFATNALTVPSIFQILNAPTVLQIATLEPGAKREFDWTLKAKGLGDFALIASAITGRDAANRVVSGARATLEGEVTALILGVEQRPERIVLGEDNNKDGVVNADDMLVQLVVGLTNVSKVDVTGVRTDDLAVPLDFSSRLGDVQAALEPVGAQSGNFGTIGPGAANAVVRTNTYRATNYVFATVSFLVRGNAQGTTIQAGTQGVAKVQKPGVKITMHALEKSGLTPESVEEGKRSVNAPLVPITSSASLDAQREISGGLIGDGVTPLLFILKGDTKALAIQNDELKIRLAAKVLSGGKLLGDDLQKRIRILKEGVWTASDSAVMTQAKPAVYVCLGPIPSDDIAPAAGSESLRSSLLVQNSESEIDLEELEFGLRKPPLALLPDYHSNGGWGKGTEDIFKASRPSDPKSGVSFLKIVRVGQWVEGGDPLDRSVDRIASTTSPLDELAPLVWADLKNEIEPLKQFWAFTRYDLVGHGQGGLLARMLCSVNANGVVQPFKNDENFYRGRFHRIVTIGSPHNGSRVLRYISVLMNGERTLASLLPQGMVAGWVAHDKFDPWGSQMDHLNKPLSTAPWYPDSDASFHLVRTTVDDGLTPSLTHATFAETALGLRTSGKTVIPRGSDGVVDFDSIGAGIDAANVYTVPSSYNISHATTPLPGIDDIFGGHDGGQADSPIVAQHVIGALDQSGVPDQHRIFGTFQLPRRLAPQIRDEIDVAAGAVKTNEFGAVVPISAASGLQAFGRDAGQRTYNLKFIPPTNSPVGSQQVNWAAELFGANGVSTDGLTLTPDSSDSTRASLRVSEQAVGDVVVFAVYATSNGQPVYSKPYRAASFEPSSQPVELRVLPQGMTLPVGTEMPVELFVRYANGLRLQRHAGTGELTAASQAPLVVNVDDPVYWRCSSAGVAQVIASWRGLSATGAVTVVAQKYNNGALPVPEPLVWLRADSGINVSGTNVTSWTDQSGHGFVFTAATEATRPVWVPTFANNLPSVRFDRTLRQRLQGNLETTLSNATIFTLARFTGNASTEYLYAFGTRNTSGYMMTLARRSGNGAYHYDGAADWINPNTIAGTNVSVFSQIYGSKGPDHQQLDRNGQTVLESRTTTGRAYSVAATNIVLGNYLSSTLNFSGDLVEWIVYDRTLTDSERAQVEEYLRVRAGLEPFSQPSIVTLSSAVGFIAGSGSNDIADWTFVPTNRVLHAEGGQAPSLLVLDEARAGEEVRTRLMASGSSGALGVVFGYEDHGNFLALDWRAIAETNLFGDLSPAGMRLVGFHMPEGVDRASATDFWTSSDPARTTVWKTNDLTWVAGRVYDVLLRPASSGLTVEVYEGTTNLVRWTIPELTGSVGWFGNYTYGISAAEFGPAAIAAAPDVEPIVITQIAPALNGQWTIEWTGGVGLFQLEKSDDLSLGLWQPVGAPAATPSRTIQTTGRSTMFRVRTAP
jgi:PKD repeat protein